MDSTRVGFIGTFPLLFSTQLALGVRVPLRSGVFVAFKKEKRGFADSRPLWFAYWEPRFVTTETPTGESALELYHRLHGKKRAASREDIFLWRARCVEQWPKLVQTITHGLPGASLKALYMSACIRRTWEYVLRGRPTRGDEIVLLWKSYDTGGQLMFHHKQEFSDQSSMKKRLR